MRGGNSAAGLGPWWRARRTSPRRWRSLPSYGAWRVLTPAAPIAGSGAGRPAACHAQLASIGHSAQRGDRPAHGRPEVHQHLVPRPPGAARHERVGERLRATA